MNNFCILVFGVFLGVACGENDFECMRRISKDCNNDVWGDGEIFTKQIDFCSTNPKLMRCLKYGLFECNQMELVKETDKVIKTYNEACKDGTDMNLEMKKHQECTQSTMAHASECLKDFIELINDLKEPTEEDLAKLNQEICKQLDTIKECAYLKILEKCGSEAVAVVRSVHEPAFQLQKKVCQVLDGNNANSLQSLNLLGMPMF